MGERLGRIDALRRQGITPIGPDEGVRILRQLIASPPQQTAVVVSGRFGDPPTLRHEQPELPLLRFLEKPQLHVPGVELICDVSLSLGADPYLRDHTYQDTPLLPAVMGLEAMAQISMALAGSKTPPNFENVELSRPITVPTSGDRGIRLAALVRGPGKVEVVLRSDETGFQADHFRAMCRFDRMSQPMSVERRVPPIGARCDGEQLLSLVPREDLYGPILFHRGRFQRVEGYRELSATRCLAEVSPDGHARWFGGYLPETLLLGDAAIRDAAIHAIQACIPHGTILPIGIDRVLTGERPLTGPCSVRAQEREHVGDRFVYDLVIASPDGTLRERWEGLRLQRVDQAKPAARWAEPLLAPYLERRLGELVPGAAATISVLNNGNGDSANWHAERQRASDRAIAAAIGEPSISVRRRVDGKPVAVADRAVSVAHAGALTLSVASARRVVSCDAEPIVHREQREWSDLIAADRTSLAQLITQQSPSDDLDAAATRVWSAAECLKKAGLPTHVPLVYRESTTDRWVLLGAGGATIATWVGAVRNQSTPLAVALLVGNADEVL
jgi:enediyne polyketide synthase